MPDLPVPAQRALAFAAGVGIPLVGVVIATQLEPPTSTALLLAIVAVALVIWFVWNRRLQRRAAVRPPDDA